MKLAVLLSGMVLLFCLGRALLNQPVTATTAALAGQKTLSKEARKVLEQDLGRQLFFDPQLSVPAGQSCATCHHPAKAFADPQDRVVSAGAAPARFGNRNAAPIAYAAYTPPFQYDAPEAHYVGGFFWDGRANSLAEQALGPLLNHVEMNASKPVLFARLQQPNYRTVMVQLYGENALKDPETALNHLGQALAAFEATPTFSPFTSKFDYYKKGQAALTAEERLGMQLFIDPKKGNCAACHPAEPDERTGKILFTDYTYDNIGLPANPEIQQLLGRNYHPDLGLGAVVNQATENGKFKVPTLRNVAKTAPYFHNGVLKTLEETVQYYNARDTGKFGRPEVPQNVNREELGHLNLTPKEVKAIVAFMETLTDGYQPQQRY